MPTGREQLKQFAEDTIEELLRELPPERILKAVAMQERLKGLSAEELLNELTPEQILKALSPEQRVELAKYLNHHNSKAHPPGAAKPGD